MKHYPSKNKISFRRKILILDLDETLLHADFQNEYLNHDAEVSFTDENLNNVTVGVFFRPGLAEFLNTMKESFEMYIFTASIESYANAVIDIIDKDKTIFSGVFYRKDCVRYLDSVYVKDLKYIFGDELNDVVIVDNSLYSFMNQLSNGILISTFINNKNDLELYKLMNYLVNCVYWAKDVREINEEIFNFSGIFDEIRKNIN